MNHLPKLYNFFKKIFETCVLLINNNFCEKLVLSIGISIKLDERFTVALVPFFYRKLLITY